MEHPTTDTMRRMKRWFLFGGLLATAGCYYDKEEVLYPGSCDVGDATAAGYWTATIEPLILSRCANCHFPGGTGPGDFTQYANVKAIVDNGSFQQQVFISRSMPQGGSLSACDLQKLQAWVDAGAPQ